MFTGIVEDLGEVEAVEQLGDSARIYIRSAQVTRDAHVGDSIAVNGVCLTVTGFLGHPPDGGYAQDGGQPPDGGHAPDGGPPAPRGFTADVMGETLRLTSLKDIAAGTQVNLERSVRVTDRLGGHLVQGHVDGTGTILSRDPRDLPGGRPPVPPAGHWEVVRIGLPADIGRYVAHKGSITVDGISLTVSAVGDDWFEVSLIPETLKRTTLGAKQPGEPVNLEVDVIAKYVEKLLGGAQ